MIDRIRRFTRLTTILALLAAFFSTSLPASPLPEANPAEVEMAGELAPPIMRHVNAAIQGKKLPGCVVLIGRHGRIVHREAYGNRQLEPTVEPMTVDTVFDIASLTKPIATSTSIMQLVERGDLRLRDKVSDYLPEFARHGKEEATVEQLMVHSAGLIPDNAIADYENGWTVAYEKICELQAVSKPGTKFKYSDVGYLLLGQLVEKLSGTPLNDYAKKNIFLCLGMHETMFTPPVELQRRAAATERVDGEWLKGRVHDPRARLLQGVAGHAGLFSTADDLAIFAQTLLRGGRRGDVRILSPRTIKNWTRSRNIDGNLRGLGWDMGSAYSRNRGEMMSPSAFGHGGFTGTAMWIDPELDLFVIFLSNRLHPSGKGEANDLAGRIATIASAACLPTVESRHASTGPDDYEQSLKQERSEPTRLGIDVLRDRDFAQLNGKRVGLIANQTSLDAVGVHTASILSDAPGVELVSLFSPEHGIHGTADQPEIADTTDESSGLPVYSLYGKSRKPLPKQLRPLDVMVFDIQDIGCRFYTYVSTMGIAMEACADHGVAFMVLDRPNPIGGTILEGPMLDEGSESFVAYHNLPVRHGMTAGELAQMFRAENDLELDLAVVPVENWNRNHYLFDTSLPWVNTSPNMRSLTQALLYPGVGLFETTNVSVGRGTDTPFEVLGAPWIEPVRFAAELGTYAPPGVKVTPIRFTPDASKYAGKQCGGVRFVVTDWLKFRPLELAWAIGSSLTKLCRDDWDATSFPRLLGNATVHQKLLDGATPQDIQQSYTRELQQFRVRRQPYLLY